MASGNVLNVGLHSEDIFIPPRKGTLERKVVEKLAEDNGASYEDFINECSEAEFNTAIENIQSGDFPPDLRVAGIVAHKQLHKLATVVYSHQEGIDPISNVYRAIDELAGWLTLEAQFQKNFEDSGSPLGQQQSVQH